MQRHDYYCPRTAAYSKGLRISWGDRESNLEKCNIPTVWNQIEAAIAYTLKHPLLAIVESGLRPEGFLEEGYDWYIEWLDLTPGSLSEPTFTRAFEQWKQKVALFDNEDPAGT